MTQPNPFALDTPATTPAPVIHASVSPDTMPAMVPNTTPTGAPLTHAPDPFAGGDDPFAGPAPQQPRGPRLLDMYGRLLLLVPHLVETVPNRNPGAPAGATQQRMTADVIILDGGPCAYGGQPEKLGGAPHDKTASIPHKSPRMFVSSAGLVSQCREALAKRITTGTPGMVLGRLKVGVPKDSTQNPPYLLELPTDADKAIARQYLANVDPFA